MSQLPFNLAYVQSSPPHNEAQYMLAPHPHNHLPGHVHLVSAHGRNEAVQRKRPKYTRSKTGCLTCRLKKIKCDETKPVCQRCSHGARECAWPEPAPPKKKTSKKGAQRRPSTTESVSHVSEDSSFSHEAPSLRAASATSSLTNNSDRHYSESQVQARASSDILNARHQTLPNITQGQYSQGQSVHTSSTAPATPEYTSPYTSHLGGTYGSNNHNLTSAVPSRDSSRPSTANSLPPSRFPAQLMDNAHFHSSGTLSNAGARPAAYMGHAHWDAAVSRPGTTAGYGQYPMHSPLPELVRPYGHEHNSRN